MKNYYVLELPYNKSFFEFTSAEAKQFFEWYREKIPERVAYLFMVCSNFHGVDLTKTIYNKQSLIYLWEWFLNVAKIKRSNRITSLLSFDNFDEEFSKDDSIKFDEKTEYIIRDIGMYLGEMFVRNYNQINWSFYTEPITDFFVNQPLLLGFEDPSFTPPFKMEFEPIHMVGVKAANLFDGTSKKTDLLNLYIQWEQYIPK